MLLDNGEQVFLWLGSRCSEVEIKLAYKSAQVSRGLNLKFRITLACNSHLGLHSAHQDQATRAPTQAVPYPKEQRIPKVHEMLPRMVLSQNDHVDHYITANRLTTNFIYSLNYLFTLEFSSFLLFGFFANIKLTNKIKLKH